MFLLSVYGHSVVPPTSTEEEAKGDRIAGEIREHHLHPLKFETAPGRILTSSVLNFSRCRGPSMHPPAQRGVWHHSWLPGVFSLAGLHAVPPSSSAPAQKAGRLAIGFSTTHFRVARHPRKQAQSCLRGVSGHASPDVSENRRDAAST